MQCLIIWILLLHMLLGTAIACNLVGCTSERCSSHQNRCSYGCKQGYSGDRCDTCLSGYYESGINQDKYCTPCPTGCYNGACGTNGVCTDGCRSGYWGQTCTSSCSSGCNGNICYRDSGYCSNGCTGGYWGQTCTLSCSSGCYGNICYRDSGYCSHGCISGHWGQTCTRCSKECSGDVCNVNNGACTNGCISGYWGELCTPCPTTCNGGTCNINDGYCTVGCVAGYYGQTCATQCNIGCINRLCKNDGTCDCNTGYTGGRCESCLTGFYYDNGECKVCPDSCLSCTSSSYCQSCKPGFYGNTCSTPCSSGCNNNVCATDGTCNVGCKPDFYGQTCVNCSPGCADVCNSYKGHCTCKDGYGGTKCDQCEDGRFKVGTECQNCPQNCFSCTSRTDCTSCIPGYYGTLCNTLCSPGCQNRCTINYGACTCKPGYTGALCERCKKGWYMDNMCMSCSSGCLNEDCNSSNGTCTCKENYTGNTCDECMTGWYMDNDLCYKCPDYCAHCISYNDCQLCAIGFHGTNCQLNCSIGCNQTRCDKDDGTCTNGCVLHYYGQLCENQCSGHCINGANGTRCDQDSGACIYGCKAGYQKARCNDECGNNCDSNTSQDVPGSLVSTFMIVGISAGIVLGAVIGSVLTVLVCVRRKSRHSVQQQQHNQSPQIAMVSNGNETGYENIDNTNNEYEELSGTRDHLYSNDYQCLNMETKSTGRDIQTLEKANYQNLVI